MQPCMDEVVAVVECGKGGWRGGVCVLRLCFVIGELEMGRNGDGGIYSVRIRIIGFVI